MTLQKIDAKLDRALSIIARDLHYMGPTDRQAYAARLIDRLSYVFTGADVDAELLNVHPAPDLWTSTAKPV